MKYLLYCIYIICIAFITMFLIYIGYLKDRNLPAELTNKLYRKCCSKALKYLKDKGYASAADIRNIISDTTATVVWSRKKVKVTNPAQFTNYVIDGLISKGDIIEESSGKKRVYKLCRNV